MKKVLVYIFTFNFALSIISCEEKNKEFDPYRSKIQGEYEGMLNYRIGDSLTRFTSDYKIFIQELASGTYEIAFSDIVTDSVSIVLSPVEMELGAATNTWPSAEIIVLPNQIYKSGCGTESPENGMCSFLAAQGEMILRLRLICDTCPQNVQTIQFNPVTKPL